MLDRHRGTVLSACAPDMYNHVESPAAANQWSSPGLHANDPSGICRFKTILAFLGGSFKMAESSRNQRIILHF